MHPVTHLAEAGSHCRSVEDQRRLSCGMWADGVFQGAFAISIFLRRPQSKERTDKVAESFSIGFGELLVPSRHAGAGDPMV